MNFIILQQQIEELEQAQFEQVGYVCAVQYSEWTTYVLEMSAKDATACNLLERQRSKADVDCIEHSYVTAINHY